ncbi:putative Hydroxyethylthiazole kinase [Vibrio nigripulchritudo SO65]|uniref:hydroxyethylthiazole kinase n=1 Tax=Vibrio nigripulchritudo TaxID=28173 RepID=UPI0003B22130|nr:hydroxyethylthiazole kinase [Vibrio nigripulchritudo]CCN34670.1 putative Hydroxyethylthiazole kinase [Vibrio nigripulchritudo AM115]CCN41077.1 putative Hydroxyethylthiazole kinase [Vibrio nigripulchritudo FTn2]CCN66620.1 putative Hydroxyethylthiazole kinase [Vibrio nigripulchritudo POn4]CCN75979.1 putative Hydroxyethylthiazole kinase [Vibrio nigripulchritudo SO65]
MNKQSIAELLTKVRENKPLVVNVTNYVVMNNTANALLSVGASPIMAHSREEMAEMMSFAGALVINIGTLDSQWLPRMEFAVEQANKNGKPVVLDPVGCGASSIRTKASRDIAKAADRLIIRGNASEIIALAGEQAQSKGVDALDSSDAALGAAKFLSEEYRCSVLVSGATDYIVSTGEVVSLANGHEMMPYVTGMGCTLSALTGAFAAVGDNSGVAAAAVLGVAGEIAAEQAKGPGSLQLELLDALYMLDEKVLAERLNIS